MNKRLTIVIVAAIAGVLIAGGLAWLRMSPQKFEDINTYQECAARYSVGDSYPSVCRTPDGRTFREPTDPSSSGETADQREAIRQAEAYQPQGVCTMALTPAIHLASGAKYTFPSGCLAPGWQAQP